MHMIAHGGLGGKTGMWRGRAGGARCKPASLQVPAQCPHQAWANFNRPASAGRGSGSFGCRRVGSQQPAPLDRSAYTTYSVILFAWHAMPCHTQAAVVRDAFKYTNHRVCVRCVERCRWSGCMPNQYATHTATTMHNSMHANTATTMHNQHAHQHSNHDNAHPVCTPTHAPH